MRNVWTIYRKECAAAFNSPIAYIVVFAFLVIMSFMFFVVNRFFSNPNPDLRGYYGILPFVFALVVPAVTMRLWSEERKQGTLELMMTLPFRPWEIVIGKFLAAYVVVAAALLLTVPVPFAVAPFTSETDSFALVASYVGAFLLAGVYLAIGAWVSSTTENQIVAYMLSVLACFVICLLGVPAVVDWVNKSVMSRAGNFVGFFGTYSHFEKFAQGQIGLQDVVYTLSMMGLFLGLNNFTVESRKY